MNIYFLRHGQTDYNKRGLIQGVIDIELNEEGVRQAKEVNSKIKDLDIDYIVYSPLGRTYKTMLYATEGINAPRVFDQRVIERRYGELEGVSMDKVEDYGYSFHDGYLDENYDKLNVETFRDMKKRINDFLEDIKKSNYRNVLVVSHGGISRAFRAILLNLEPHEVPKLKIDNCELLKFEV